MRSIRSGPAALVALAVVAWLFFGTIGTTEGQPTPFDYFYETTFVAASPTMYEDLGVVSAWENPTSGAWGPLFIDFNQWIPAAYTNTAAALDLNIYFRPGGGSPPPPPYGNIYPTGHLCVAKTQPFGTMIQNTIDVYAAWNSDQVWQNNQYNRWTLPQSPIWTLGPPPAPVSTVMAMEVANGYPLAAALPQLFLTDYLITAETLGGFITFGAYGLTDIWGNLVQPALASGTVTNLTGTVLGMAISNGTVNTGTGERTLNEIVFVVQDALNNLTLHSITFDIRTAAFGALNTGTAYATPYNLTTATGSTVFGGLSIARNYSSAFGMGFSHDVAVSVANAALPFGAPGTTFIFAPGAGVPITVASTGGGPICQASGCDVVGGGYVGAAFATFGFPVFGVAPGPFGWFVVSPGNPYTITAIDGAGAASPNFRTPDTPSAFIVGQEAIGSTIRDLRESVGRYPRIYREITDKD
jgi:hypothetical protein